MVKNGEIFQFLDQILHKNFHHFSPFFTIFHHEYLPNGIGCIQRDRIREMFSFIFVDIIV